MALIDRFTTPEGIHVVLWEPCESETELSHLPDPEIEALSQIRAPQRKVEFITVRRLIRQFIGQDKFYTHTHTGAPQIADRSFNLSISHTAGCMALAWHPTLNMGIDVEHKAPRILTLRQKFVSESESHLVRIDHQEEDLLLLWSAKESLFKIIDSQEVDFKLHLHITHREITNNTQGYLLASQNRVLPTSHFKIEYRVYPRFIYTLCTAIEPSNSML